jgi:hypothetical protein
MTLDLGGLGLSRRTSALAAASPIRVEVETCACGTASFDSSREVAQILAAFEALGAQEVILELDDREPGGKDQIVVLDRPVGPRLAVRVDAQTPSPSVVR